MDAREMAQIFKVTLKNHLEELRKNRESHVCTSNGESTEPYDRMIKNTLKSIDKMDRILTNDISPYKNIEEHKLLS
jgi:hypothetical protein